MPPYDGAIIGEFSQHSVKFDEDKRHAVYARDGYKCGYCGLHDATKSGGGLSLDHLTARANGGAAQNTKTSPADNLITACHGCNYSKQAKTPREFNAYLKANGAKAIDWSKVRAQASKKIDIKTGEKNAAAARAFRAAKGAPVPGSAPHDVPAPSGAAQPKTGPGVQHGDDGKFLPGSRPGRRVAFARFIDASVSGEAPTAARLWRAGWNATDKGDLNFTPESLRLVLADQESRGNPLAWYYEHEDTIPLAERGGTPMRGVCSAPSSMLTGRGPATAPELWAEQIAWTDEAKRQISAGERRQLSPIAAYDEETREIVAIRNVSLCAEGATWHGTLLASRSAKGTGSMDDLIQQLIDACNNGDFETAEAIVAQMEATDGGGTYAKMARGLMAKMAKAGPPPPPPPPAAPPVAAKQMAALTRGEAPPGVNFEAFNRKIEALDAATARADAAAKRSDRATVTALLSRAIETGLPIDLVDEREQVTACDPTGTERFIASLKRKAKVGVLVASKEIVEVKPPKPGAEAKDPAKPVPVETFGLSEIEMGEASKSGVTFAAFAAAKQGRAARGRHATQNVGGAPGKA